jgi:hypothetical protein
VKYEASGPDISDLARTEDRWAVAVPDDLFQPATSGPSEYRSVNIHELLGTVQNLSMSVKDIAAEEYPRFPGVD